MTKALNKEEREKEIVELFRSGRTCEEIADKLSIPGHPLIPFMVQSYLTSAARKRGMTRQAFEAELKKEKES